MDGISKCTNPDEVFHLSIQVRLMCNNRYPHLMTWFTWIGTLKITPSDADINRWCEGIESETEIMAEDVWDILTIKVASPLSSAIYHAMIRGGVSLDPSNPSMVLVVPRLTGPSRRPNGSTFRQDQHTDTIEGLEGRGAGIQNLGN